MTIKTFIEKAIRGGWNEREWFEKHTHICSAIFLDPAAWQAVGKTERWHLWKKEPNKPIQGIRDWRDVMHSMIDALAEGKTIEQFLQEV